MNPINPFRWSLLFALPVLLSGCLDQDTAQAASDGAGDTQAQPAAKANAPKLLYYRHPMNPDIHSDVPAKDDMGMDFIPVYEELPGDAADRKPLFYQHPMNPDITSDTPKKDDMGMDYIPIYEEGGANVTIDPVVVHNMGVRTAKAEISRLWRRIDTVANVGLDENKVTQINLRTDGWIERLAVKSEGERVKQGDVLFALYSPTLVNAQEEYLQALAAKHARLIDASRERLAALGVSPGQIKQLANTRKVQQRLRIYAPQDGIVAKLSVREGQYVKPATAVMTLADLSSVWLVAEVFERQADWVRVGAPAEVKLAYLPGRTWEGEVDFIYPSLDAKTRTLKVRLRFDNADETLKPNMFAKVTIFGGAKKNILVVPRESLIRTGDQDRVILARGQGRFTPREVTVGIESGDWMEILSGLRAGDTVVTSGQFLIDSEASIKASILRLDGGASKLVAKPQATAMADMSHDDPAPINATGRVVAVMPDERRIELDHDAIPAIGWPAMKMPFKVGDGVMLHGLKPGDSVRFELSPDGDGYAVTAVQQQSASE